MSNPKRQTQPNDMLRALRAGARFDLHLHTNRSDGRYDPEDVIRRCVGGGLDVVAITDHDLPPAHLWGEHRVGGRKVRVIAGAEITGTHDGREMHLLVYFPGDVPQAFRDFCRRQTQERARRYAMAVEQIGLPDMDLPDAEAVGGDRALTRLHLAHALVEAGHAKSTRDAFKHYLSGAKGKVPTMQLSFVEAIKLARSMGGLTSWAHPPLQHVKEYIAEFARAGLHGIEALRPYVNAKARKVYKRLAKKHDLFLTGGSDWHGWREADGDPGLFTVEKQQIEPFLEALMAAPSAG